MIKIDISLWLQRGIWPLSSYTPSPFVCQSLPGFDDFSQEEIRWEGQIAALQRNPQAYVSIKNFRFYNFCVHVYNSLIIMGPAILSNITCTCTCT